MLSADNPAWAGRSDAGGSRKSRIMSAYLELNIPNSLRTLHSLARDNNAINNFHFSARIKIFKQHKKWKMENPEKKNLIKLESVYSINN